MPNARLGNGTTLKIGATNVGELTNIGAVEATTDPIDVSTLASDWREFIPGMRDGGEVVFAGHFFPGDAGQAALKAAHIGKTTDPYTITFPGGLGAWTFNAFITKFSVLDATNEDPIGFEIGVKITGEPSLGNVAVAGLSALVLTGTAGALSPAFNNAKYNYSWSFTTLSSITVTPTGASQTMDIYVDGALHQSGLASGAASIPIDGFSGAAISRRIDVVARESGKTPKTYTIVAIRTA